MSTNRSFTLVVAITLVVIIAFAAQAAISSAKSIHRESEQQVQREYELGERYGEIADYIVEEDLASLSYISRLNKCFDMPFSELASCRNALDEPYGELPGYIAGFSPEQIQRESILGERYGEIPQRIAGFSVEQIRREYILSERYAVTPQGYAQQQAVREYWLGERYGQTP